MNKIVKIVLIFGAVACSGLFSQTHVTDLLGDGRYEGRVAVIDFLKNHELKVGSAAAIVVAVSGTDSRVVGALAIPLQAGMKAGAGAFFGDFMLNMEAANSAEGKVTLSLKYNLGGGAPNDLATELTVLPKLEEFVNVVYLREPSVTYAVYIMTIAR